MDLLLLLLALAGHAFLWIGLVNRLHSLGLRRWVIHLLTDAFFLLAGVIPLGIAAWLYVRSPGRLAIAPWLAGGGGLNRVIVVYTIACWAVAVATLLRLVWLRCFVRMPPLVRFRGKRWAEIEPRAAEFGVAETAHHFFTRLPLNEILRLEVTDWMLEVPRLPPRSTGCRSCIFPIST